jgi:HK97 gp10 family phage protein
VIKITLEVSGLREFAEAVENLRKNLPDIIREELTKTGEATKADARITVPVLTGATRDSIYFSVSGFDLTLGAGTPYSPFLEWGTIFMAPRPFMRPAIDRNFPSFLQNINRRFSEALET